jgi:DNA-directed RNA polymerase specialized sigma24 family protein
MVLEETHAEFEPTRWTWMDALSSADGSARQQALERLVRRYWPAVYAALRAHGASRDEASEITQGFFSDVVLTRNLFQQADHKRGRLRAMILTALRNYQIDRHRSNGRRINATFATTEQIDHEDARLNQSGDETTEDAFDRRWALGVLHEAVERCRRHFDVPGQSSKWRAFERRVLDPSAGTVEPPPLAQIAAELGFTSPIHAGAAVQQVRKRMVLLMREIVAETVGTAEEIETEYQHLLALLKR